MQRGQANPSLLTVALHVGDEVLPVQGRNKKSINLETHTSFSDVFFTCWCNVNKSKKEGQVKVDSKAHFT